MATKTLTITEDAYNLLKNSKSENESFSEEIVRIMSEKKKRPLTDFFGIISEEMGNSMLKSLEQQRKIDIKLEKERFKEMWG